MTTDQQLNEIQSKWEAVQNGVLNPNDGPFKVTQDEIHTVKLCNKFGTMYRWMGAGNFQAKEFFEFILSANELVPELIAEIHRLRQTLKGVRDESIS